MNCWANPIRGAKRSLLGYIRPRGIPDCPPIKAHNFPYSWSRLLQLREMSTSGDMNSYRRPASIVVRAVTRQVSWTNASAYHCRRFILGVPYCN